MAPQTSPDTSKIPWGWLSGKIAFVNQDEGQYASRQYLYVIDASNRSVKEVLTIPERNLLGALISPRGDQIAYNQLGSNGITSSVLNLSNGKVTTVNNSTCIGYTPNNEPVYYYFYPDTTNKELRINGSKVNFAIDPQSNIACAPDDAFWVYSSEIPSGGYQLMKFDLQDSTYHTIGSCTLGDTITQATNPDVSQDGRHIVYTKSFLHVRRYSEIWVMNIDGTSDHMIISGDHLNYDYAMWSPDDKHIVCSSGVVYDSDYYGYDVGRNIWIYDAGLDSLQQLVTTNGFYSSWSK